MALTLVQRESSCLIGIIDWQHAVILPLSIRWNPRSFSKLGYPLSKILSKPDVKLPENFDQLGHNEQATVQETVRRRIIHFGYAASTMKSLPDHFTQSYKGESVSLKHTIFRVLKNWRMPLDKEAQTTLVKRPV